MSKVAIVFWSGSGNTQSMANAVAEGVKAAGGEASVIFVSDFKAADIASYDAFAWGCPAMGAEVLEEAEFEPVFSECKSALAGKKVALFGSYGWGDGEWMRSWESDCEAAGITLAEESLIVNETPDEAGLEQCREFGRALV